MKRSLSQTAFNVSNLVTFTVRGLPNAAYQVGQPFNETTMQIRATVWSTDDVDDIKYSVISPTTLESTRTEIAQEGLQAAAEQSPCSLPNSCL